MQKEMTAKLLWIWQQWDIVVRVRLLLPDFQVPGCPLRFSEFPEPLELEAPFLGEHNRDVLEHLLGFSEEKIKTLEESGVLSTESETN